MIPYARQDISEADIAAVVDVLRSPLLTQGPQVPAFEAAVKARVGASHAFAYNSATSALHAACMALGLAPGQRLWTTPITFVASANCARYCGAAVDFVDIDPHTCNIDPVALEARLREAADHGTLPAVVVAVDFGGQPADYDALAALRARYGFRLIEDASHALGARWNGRPVGAGAWADCTVFSFHPVKILTTGEGGMVCTEDAALAARLDRLRSHGIVRDRAQMLHAAGEGDWYYEQQELGWNYRMTELQAALGSSQLARLDDFLARRREIAARYDIALRELPLQLPQRDPRADSAWHLYPVQVADAATRSRVFAALREAGIWVQVHYIPVNHQPYYRDLGHRPEDTPHALAYYRRAISLPMYPALRDEEQDFVVATLRGLLA